MKKLSILFLFISFSAYAQTSNELKGKLSTKKSAITKLQKEAVALQAKIDALPGWRLGAFGTVGGNLSGFNNWYSKKAPNSSAGDIGITVNGFANLIQDKFFWRNTLNLNLGWVKFDDKNNSTDSDAFETATDVFTLSSLYGRNLTKKWAVSGLAEYRTTIIDNFNNPGYLDLGLGFTWTPVQNLIVVIHPVNYNIVFSNDKGGYESSTGTKLVANYSAKYFEKLSVKSNLSLFQSYKSSNLSNWTWTNSLGYTLWRGIGVGFELGLRQNKQEALANAIANYNSLVHTSPSPTFNNVDNKLQSYWLFGLNYSF